MKRVSIVIIILLLSGCATTSTIVTGNRRTPVSPDNVRVYSQYPEEYEEVAIITARAEDGWTEDHKVQLAVNALKKRAAELGANGIVITCSNSSLTSASVMSVGNLHRLSVDRVQEVTGTAIYVPE